MDYVAKCPPTGTENPFDMIWEAESPLSILFHILSRLRYLCEQLGNVLTDGKQRFDVRNTCVFHRQQVTSNQYLDFSFIHHTSIHDDPVLISLSAATLVFLFFAIDIYRKEEEMASLFKLKVLLSLSLSLAC